MSPDRTDVLIAGAGLAGSRTAESLRALGFDGRVMVVGEEPHHPYERPALSKAFLAGERTRGALALRAPEFWSANGIELLPAARIELLDLRERLAVIDGRPLRWRRLVLATGLRGRRLPALADRDNVHQLRTLDDAAGLCGAIGPGAHLAIVGAGFVGLEVASTARQLGAAVTVIDLAPVPFAATLGAAVGARMGEVARAAGVDLRLERSIERVVGSRRRVQALHLSDGSRVECDAVLVGIGALPNSEIGGGRIALAADGGFAVDERGRSSIADVFACGDVASVAYGGIGYRRSEHWSAAAAQARAVAHGLVDRPPPPAAPAYFWTEQFGHRLQVVGHVDPSLTPAITGSEAGFEARYRDAAGTLQAVALLDRPDLLAAARAELAHQPGPDDALTAVA